MKNLLIFLSDYFHLFTVAPSRHSDLVDFFSATKVSAIDPDLFINVIIWEVISFKTIVIAVLATVSFIFYYKLSTLKNHFRDLEDDVSKQTEGLRVSNTILAKKNEEIYRQVSKIIAQQE